MSTIAATTTEAGITVDTTASAAAGTTADLVIESQGMVHYICRKYFKPGLQCLDYEDLVQIGNIGLINAAKRYKPEKGYQFSTYAYRLIVHAIQRYFRDHSAGGIKIPRRQKQAGLAVPCFSYQAEVAGAAGSDTNAPLRYESLMGEEQDFSGAYVDEFCRALGCREEKIIKMRLAGLTQQEIARAFGISQAQVSRDISKIRERFAKYSGQQAGQQSGQNERNGGE